MKDCVFCKICLGELSSVKIYEDDKCMVILDKFPNTKGQSLVIAKKHEPYVFALDDELYSHVFLVAKKIAKAIDKALKPKKTCLVVEGFDVDHNHIKLYPSYECCLNLKFGPEAKETDLEKIADKIKKFL